MRSTTDQDLRVVAHLAFDEMLQDFDRLENVIDSRKTSEIDLLRSIGFAIEAATMQEGSAARFHRAWLNGERRLRKLPNEGGLDFSAAQLLFGFAF